MKKRIMKVKGQPNLTERNVGGSQSRVADKASSSYRERSYYCQLIPILTFSRLLVGLLFSSLDSSIVATSLVTISKDLEDFVNAPWIILAYLLTYMGMTSLILPCPFRSIH